MNCTSSKLLVAHIFDMQRSYYHFNMNTHDNSEEGSFIGSAKKTIADTSNKTPPKYLMERREYVNGLLKKSL